MFSHWCEAKCTCIHTPKLWFLEVVFNADDSDKVGNERVCRGDMSWFLRRGQHRVAVRMQRGGGSSWCVCVPTEWWISRIKQWLSAGSHDPKILSLISLYRQCVEWFVFDLWNVFCAVFNCFNEEENLTVWDHDQHLLLTSTDELFLNRRISCS